MTLCALFKESLIHSVNSDSEFITTQDEGHGSVWYVNDALMELSLA